MVHWETADKSTPQAVWGFLKIGRTISSHDKLKILSDIYCNFYFLPRARYSSYIISIALKSFAIALFGEINDFYFSVCSSNS